MKTSLSRKTYALFAALLLVLAGLLTGCSGINATKSVSPLDFLLPGLMQNNPSSPGTNKADIALSSTDGAEQDKVLPSGISPANTSGLP